MDFIAGLFAPFTTVNGWIEVLILMFLELALGIDNLVFIAITSDRLPPDKQHIGRRLGLAAAMIMRIILLCLVVWIMSINITLFELPWAPVVDYVPPDALTPEQVAERASNAHFTVQSLVFLLGGAYLVFKGFTELREAFHATVDAPAAPGEEAPKPRKTIGLAQAVGTIMVMDIVFSLDSVITAAGLSGKILVMIIAVIGAVTIMIIFADPISNFINRNFEIKTVALTFIMLVGVELLLEAFHIDAIAGAPVSALLYAMMIFGFITAMLIMLLRHRREGSMIAMTHNDEHMDSQSGSSGREAE